MGEVRSLVVITGMSGAGRSLAAKVFEDLGYFVVDNLPPGLLQEVVDHTGALQRPRARLAVVVDTRAAMSFEELEQAMYRLNGIGFDTTLLFLDADDATLLRRYEEHRRPHPVDGATLGESISLEREALLGLRELADRIIDTSELTPHELRNALEDAYREGKSRRHLRVALTSFGFKRGLPRILDLLFDVRFLPNPYWEPELRDLTGRDEAVRKFVLSNEDSRRFLDMTTEMLDFLLPRFTAEGKTYLGIGVGCTGGRHRSVALTEELADWLEANGFDATVSHRDMDL